MRTPLILAAVLALTACGGGAGGTMTPPVSAPSNTVPPSNGEAFTLATCVPVYNLNAGSAQVGTACSGIAPSSSHNSFELNGDAAIACEAQVPENTDLISAFICKGNPY